MNIEQDIHIPKGLLMVAIQNFPFKGDRHHVLNFLLQGLTVFVVSFTLGFMTDRFVTLVCRW